jgi:predicted metal-dependent HD superfamily phosphohydrolase
MSRTVPWTRLEDTPIWHECKRLYCLDRKRSYHNFEHIRAMYDDAYTLGYKYDPWLDHAILAHDLVYDDKPNKEIRSVQDYATIFEDTYKRSLPSEVYNHVFKTVDHEFSSDNRMVILDLWGFSDAERCSRNFYSIVRENTNMYADYKPHMSADFLKTMYERLRKSSKHTVPFYSTPILHGVAASIGMFMMNDDK